MQRIRRASSAGSIRRSSISARDIQALQQALQRQHTVSNRVISILVVLLPFFSLFYLYAIYVHKGALGESLSGILFESPYFAVLFPPLLDAIAWKITAVLLSLQLIFYWFLPHDMVTVLSTSIGNHQKAVNGSSAVLLISLLYPLGAALKFYRPDLFFLHFPGIIGCMCIISMIAMLGLYCAYRFGEHNTIDSVSEFFFGVEVYPIIADVDVKHFSRTRITFVLWSIHTISALFYQKHIEGEVQISSACCALVQLVYITKTIWNEDLMLNALDSRRAKCGLYRIWGDLVFFPILYTTPMTVIVQQNRSVSLVACIVYTLVALFATYLVCEIDRQKYQFRAMKGLLKINHRDPYFITAKFKTDTGESSANLLLGSGYWGICRHPNYLCECVIFWSFCALQNWQPLLCYFPAIFITVYLLARTLNDENRCLLKYGTYWIQYCQKVPYRLIPGVY